LRKKRQGQRVAPQSLPKASTAQSLAPDFCDKIGAKRTFAKILMSAKGAMNRNGGGKPLLLAVSVTEVPP
jgi:hypothetical protein